MCRRLCLAKFHSVYITVLTLSVTNDSIFLKKYGTSDLYAIRPFPLKPPGHYLLFYVRTVCPVSTTYRKVVSRFERLPPLGPVGAKRALKPLPGY